MVFKITVLQSFCGNKPNFAVCDIRGTQWQVLGMQQSGQSILLLCVESRCDLWACLPGSSITWANTQQHRRDVNRALLTLLDRLWGFPKFKVLDPYHIHLFTIVVAETSTTGVTRKGMRWTEGVLSLYWHETLWGVQAHRLTACNHTTSFACCRACFNTKEFGLWKEWASMSSNKIFQVTNV